MKGGPTIWGTVSKLGRSRDAEMEFMNEHFYLHGSYGDKVKYFSNSAKITLNGKEVTKDVETRTTKIQFLPHSGTVIIQMQKYEGILKIKLPGHKKRHYQFRVGFQGYCLDTNCDGLLFAETFWEKK